jgi:hypothetical protein
MDAWARGHDCLSAPVPPRVTGGVAGAVTGGVVGGPVGAVVGGVGGAAIGNAGTVLIFVCGLGTMGREELSHGPTQGTQDPGCYS